MIKDNNFGVDLTNISATQEALLLRLYTRCGKAVVATHMLPSALAQSARVECRIRGLPGWNAFKVGLDSFAVDVRAIRRQVLSHRDYKPCRILQLVNALNKAFPKRGVADEHRATVVL